MITSDDIKNLAHLARIEVPHEEAGKLAQDMEGILAYVGEVSTAVLNAEIGTGQRREAETGVQAGFLKNVFREDVPDHEKGAYTEEILANAPARDGGFVKVKKIL